MTGKQLYTDDDTSNNVSTCKGTITTGSDWWTIYDSKSSKITFGEPYYSTGGSCGMYVYSNDFEERVEKIEVLIKSLEKRISVIEQNMLSLITKIDMLSKVKE
ncbi:MAG: hypothetical protein GF411_03045 [Candidatus Lokiarchaeota archaeon]|nr:hypothetical protein [Candidatus Lokiarchaeota archaeon]